MKVMDDRLFVMIFVYSSTIVFSMKLVIVKAVKMVYGCDDETEKEYTSYILNLKQRQSAAVQ
jgi:hypothetical protein